MADLRGGDLSRLRQLNSLTAIRALRSTRALHLRLPAPAAAPPGTESHSEDHS